MKKVVGGSGDMGGGGSGGSGVEKATCTVTMSCEGSGAGGGSASCPNDNGNCGWTAAGGHTLSIWCGSKADNDFARYNCLGRME